MSIFALVGAVIAVIILCILVNIAIKLFSKYVFPIDGVWIYVIWGITLIIGLLLFAYVLNIPVPYFKL